MEATHFLATLLDNHLGDESSFVEVRHDPVFLLWASFGICQSAKVWHCPRSHVTHCTASNCNITRSHLSQHLFMLPSNQNFWHVAISNCITATDLSVYWDGVSEFCRVVGHATSLVLLWLQFCTLKR